MIKAIVFDCFGVLTEDGWLAFLNKYVDEKDWEAARRLNKQNDLGVVKYEEFLDQLCELSGVERDVADDMIRRHHTRNVALLELIEDLKKSYKIGLLSNVSHNFLSDFLTAEDIELFDSSSLSGEIGHIKPEPEAYQDICSKLRVNPSEAVFFDDREGYVAGAKQIGMQAFIYTDVPKLKRDLESLGVNW